MPEIRFDAGAAEKLAAIELVTGMVPDLCDRSPALAALKRELEADLAANIAVGEKLRAIIGKVWHDTALLGAAARVAVETARVEAEGSDHA